MNKYTDKNLYHLAFSGFCICYWENRVFYPPSCESGHDLERTCWICSVISSQKMCVSQNLRRNNIHIFAQVIAYMNFSSQQVFLHLLISKFDFILIKHSPQPICCTFNNSVLNILTITTTYKITKITIQDSKGILTDSM